MEVIITARRYPQPLSIEGWPRLVSVDDGSLRLGKAMSTHMRAPTGNLTAREQRRIDLRLNELHKSSAIAKPSEWFALSNHVARTIRLSMDRTPVLTDAGVKAEREIVETIYRANIFNRLVDWSDIFRAWRSVIAALWSEGLRPDDASELLTLIRTHLEDKINTYTYVAPMFGVETTGIDEIPLGSLRLVRPSLNLFKDVGVKLNKTFARALERSTKELGSHLWLLGSTKGTEQVALRQFREKAELISGVLAIVAATTHTEGASRFRIGVTPSPDKTKGACLWTAWSKKERLVFRGSSFGAHANLDLTKDLYQQLNAARVFQRACGIIDSDERTELEEAIAKAVYWYSDAHRDPVPVMRLIKYWSCVEAFVSDKNETAHSVTIGLTNVLVRGPYQYFREEDLTSLKKRVSNLYGLRSRALHDAHRGIVDQDEIDLSQWSAWMIVNMLACAEAGCTKIAEIKSKFVPSKQGNASRQ